MSSPRLVQGMHHVGVVVSSVDEAIDFYRSCFGGEVEMLLRDVGGVEAAQLHGLPSARYDLAFLRYGSTRLELFEFHEPASTTTKRLAANMLGATHIAFEVDDIHAAYRRLTERGVRFTRPPHMVGEGDGQFGLVFCADPDGNRIELISTPSPSLTAGRCPASLVCVSILAQARERFEQLLFRVVRGASGEPGTQQYAVHLASEDPLTYWIYERYDDEDALATHRQMPALGELLSEMGPLLSAPPQIIKLTTIDTTA